jgi:hypothetical protein
VVPVLRQPWRIVGGHGKLLGDGHEAARWRT